MAAMFGPVVILTVLLAGAGADVTVVKVAHNTTVELRCVDRRNDGYYPAWYMNGSAHGYKSNRDEDTGELIVTLTINGSRACGTFNAHCRLYSGKTVHNTILTVEGRLPSPENVHINESSDSLAIEWNPPYSAINNESSFVHVNPHITQYTVYIIDDYTGNFIDEVNVTETSFRTDISDDHSCPMYRVSAWNSGGEGDVSVPQPGYLLRIPNSIEAEDIDTHRVSGALDIHLHVTDPCTVRIPSSFLVTVMSSDRDIIATVQYPNTTIHVALPQNVDECLIVNISAGNSAGMSLPTEISVGCQIADHSTTTTTTTSTGSDATSTDLVDQNQQGDNNIVYTAIPVGAVVIVGAGVLLLIFLRKHNRTAQVKPPEDVVRESLSLGRPPPDSPPVYSPPAVYATPEPLNRSRPPYSETARTLSSDSDKSDYILLPAPKPAQPKAPEGNPQLMYARIDPAKHSRPQPPENGNHQVQYAQIQFQDQR